MGRLMIGATVLWLLCGCASVWITASLITSVLKSATKSCGNSYEIESYGVSGDWFCSEKE